MSDTAVALPVRVRKTLGLGVVGLLTCVGLTALYAGFDVAGAAGPLVSRLSSAAGMLALMGLYVSLFFLLRTPSELTIDASGVTYIVKRQRLFVAWGDIDRITGLEKTARIELKGRPESDGLLIPGALLKDAACLAATLREGLVRWGGPGPGSARSDLPAAFGLTQSLSALRRAAMGMGLLAAFLTVILVMVILLPALKDDRLRSHGVRMQATIIKTFRGDCGRHGCVRKVLYSYVMPDGRAFETVASVGSDREESDKSLYVQSHSLAPIAVDPDHPSMSDLNVDDSVFKSNHLGVATRTIGIVLAMLLGVFSLFGVAIFLDFRKAKRTAATAG